MSKSEFMSLCSLLPFHDKGQACCKQNAFCTGVLSEIFEKWYFSKYFKIHWSDFSEHGFIFSSGKNAVHGTYVYVHALVEKFDENFIFINFPFSTTQNFFLSSR